MSHHSSTVSTPLSTNHSVATSSMQPSPHVSASHSTTANPSSSSHPQQQQPHHHQHHHSSYHHLSYEERLPKLWRPLLSSVANCMTKAEKAAVEPTQINCKELNDSVVTFLRTRVEWHRLLGNVQAKLQGQAQEREALEGYVRTQPRLGKRKRHDTTLDGVLVVGGGGASSTDLLAVSVELQTAMQQEVVATSSSAATGTSDGIGNGGPGGDDFISADFDGALADNIV